MKYRFLTNLFNLMVVSAFAVIGTTVLLILHIIVHSVN